MSELIGQRGELSFTVTVKRKATGKEETYRLVSIVEGDDAEKAQRMVEEINARDSQTDEAASSPIGPQA